MILNFSSYSERSEYSADVVVVGTGAGGAVVGAELAEAGMDVLMVEEGSWHPTSSFNPYLSESVPRLYRDAGATIIVGSPPIPYLEGRCVGGSTVINGGMSWRTPEPILDEWVRLTGDDSLSSQGLESEFERVEERVSVKHQHPVSVGDDSRLMAAGARK
ncbi:MAG: GMC oxidoreductase, partial [Deltaproteobacteria bacterium CG_4_9_14_3_um_filter_63_12]